MDHAAEAAAAAEKAENLIEMTLTYFGRTFYMNEKRVMPGILEWSNYFFRRFSLLYFYQYNVVEYCGLSQLVEVILHTKWPSSTSWSQEDMK